MSAETPAAVPPAPRSPWQKLYQAAHRGRRAWFRRRAERLPRPVVSVGNLTWGGSGKTPLVAAIAAGLRDRGLRVAVLSRGYKGKGAGVRVVSSGEGPLLGPLVAGDEPVLLAGQLPGVGVVVGPDRYQAGLHALERLPEPPDVFVLDDGFSHVRLFRDLDLLVFSRHDPFAGGRLPPGGRLREPLESARWADAIVWSGRGADDARALARGLTAYGFDGPGFCAAHEVLAPRAERDRAVGEASVVLVAGIARPERVKRSAEKAGCRVIDFLEFPDHHPYPDESLRRIERRFRDSGAEWVLTTAKDHVKLVGRLDAPLALLPFRARPEEAFWDWMTTALDEIRARPVERA